PGRSHAEDLAYLRAFLDGVANLDTGGSARDQHEKMAMLERIKGAACGAQVIAGTMMQQSVVEARTEAGVHGNNPAYGVGVQAGMARRESPTKGRAFMAYSNRMIQDLPLTFAALLAGNLNEAQALAIDSETQHLPSKERQEVDAELMRTPHALDGMCDRQVVDTVRRLAYRYDSLDALTRLEDAKAGRYAAAFPARDGMMQLAGLLPIDDGLAVHQALDEAAAQIKKAGDPRTLAQIRADVLVDRVTGRQPGEGVKIILNLVMNDRTLFQGSSEPAHLIGYGTVPSTWARMAVAGRDPQDKERYRGLVSLKRIYTHPDTGSLVAMDSRSRQFPTALKDLISIRDRYCRTPWCNAPIKHFDHVVQHSRGGPTSEANSAGRCAGCNQTKEQ
ncbi:HNH endonuclease, partial [Arthrobacter sp. AQ5-05]|uniref:HNH endonuclease n=1 Tax=Arthrobacter sp. AQ5-05 TaxID=2184581 RepID=UPI000DCB9C08